MILSLRRVASLFALSIVACGGGLAAHAQESPPAAVDAAPAVDPAPVIAALDQLDAWVGAGANGDRWRNFIKSRPACGPNSPRAPKSIRPTRCSRCRSCQAKANGLQLAPFQQAARRARRLFEVRSAQQFNGDFAKLAWAARGDHQPLTPKSSPDSATTMRDKARELDRAMGGNTPLARNWKKFLAVGRADASLRRRL